LTTMNPRSFEFKSSFLVYLASHLHTNRFFEFVQNGKFESD